MPELHPAAPGSSYATVAGPLAFTGGQAPRRPDGSVPDDLDEQVTLVLDNLEAALALVGAKLSQVVHLRAYAVDRDALRAWVRLRTPRLAGATPAATTVLVAGLGDPRWRLEVEATACIVAGGS
ncbi:MAG TPA: Rid family hydrolase [Solirubrobacteraceae bacterium]|jgi:enamine deaminase RidA (YjgF/YER057c/UK114 family)